jgi:predicted Zn-dependent protease
VHVEAARTGLRILSETREPLAEWSFAGLYPSEEVYPGQPLRLMHKDAGPAYVTIEDSVAIDSLRRQAPAFRAMARVPQPATRRQVLRAIGILAASIVALAWAFPRLAGWVVPLVPYSWERAMGDQVLAALKQAYPPCETARDADGRHALERLVARLAASPAAEGQAPPGGFTVDVLDTPVPNALATPGGHIVVFRGMLDLPVSPAELAGVLAHETGHALSRHPLQGMLRALGWQWLLSAALGSSWAPQSVQTLLSLAYTREDERAADRLGLRLLVSDHLRSDGLASLMDRLAADPRMNGRGPPGFLMSHPLPESRAKTLRQLESPGGAPPWTPREWTAIRSLCLKPR